jgi:ribosomal protein S18 acetylase RimI-like enzyme
MQAFLSLDRTLIPINGSTMSFAYEIRRLSGADAEAYRAIRLEGLERHPAAFSASLKEESDRPLSSFAERLDGNYVLGAEQDGRLVGVAGFYRHDSEKTRHRGSLWGMYVREEARGTGIARRLVDGILDHARQRVEEVGLSVWTENAAAIALYKRAGFVVIGQDLRALKIGDAYFDHLLMQVRF